ncbi:serine/threonine-protein kinase A-Raf isoform X2 [Lepeophtheirus salmonis]|uniref:non-specific serine/threonine protein kinase n=1 Tax=Lepeophtheirus salmonis TaxID=72036 RepID=A0A0K2VGJ2_LEPSM|nr:serine/threonine-protein kinase A-Raf-like isoform X2 [Lepeophtheirus salmonis]
MITNSTEERKSNHPHYHPHPHPSHPHSSSSYCSATMQQQQPQQQHDEYNQLVEDLINIQHHIRLTKDHIDKLNERFAPYQHPPGIFVTEYEELTSKLHDFTLAEASLKEKLLEMGPSESPPWAPPPAKSPVRTIVRAHLGDHGHTFVPTKKGITLREALSKAMKLRKLTPETCAVYKCSDPTKTPISWDMDISLIDSEEIKVEISTYFPVTTSISHNFVRKTFFSLAFCECCRRLLFQGFCCRTCGYKFHQKCADNVPKLCQQVRMQKVLVQAMLANHNVGWRGSFQSSHIDSEAGIIMPGGGTVGHSGDAFPFPPPAYATSGKKSSGSEPNQISSRDRSSSAPNVHSTSITPETVLSENYVYRNNKKDILTHGMVTLDELYNLKSSSGSSSSNVAFPSGGNPTSPTKSSRSVSSSPTSTLRQPRARASSADDSANKRIKNVTKESIEDWEIPPKDILVYVKSIGMGSFGTVYRGYWHGPVATKTLNVKNPSPEQIQAFRNEVALLRKTRHVNILLFMGCVSKKIMAIITQWCEGSSLHKHIHVEESKFELLNTIEIARQTSQGMDYLHAKNIIHRDLKSSNIFLHDDNFTVKIGDFGLATVKSRWKDSQVVRQPTGSVLWMAPEIIKIKTEDAFSYQSDVYAFGIVLYELLSGILPYSDGGIRKTGAVGNGKGLSVDQILWLVGTGQVVPNMSGIRSDTPQALRRLMMNCIQHNRNLRPLFPQVLAVVEGLMRSLPKINRSLSEPILNRSGLQSDELSNCSTPKTPGGGNIA